MQNDILEGKRLQVRRKKSHHWYILTPNHPDGADAKYMPLIVELQAQYQAGKKPAQYIPIQIPVDYSI